MQQALGSLLEKVKNKDPNMDDIVQTVRDIFAMSTKSLDQTARAGAFHHMVRRKATIFDTGLSDYKEYSSAAASLPLTGDGVFGPKFDEKLKSNQEQCKQLKEVLPELAYKSSSYKPTSTQARSYQGQKRRSYGGQQDSLAKRPRFDGPSRGGYSRAPYTATSSRGQTSATRTAPASKPWVSNFRIPKKTSNDA